MSSQAEHDEILFCLPVQHENSIYAIYFSRILTIYHAAHVFTVTNEVRHNMCFATCI